MNSSSSRKVAFASMDPALAEENINVCIRFRPQIPSEVEGEAWKVDANNYTITQLVPLKGNKILRNFVGFKHVFTGSATNQQVYDEMASNIVESSLQGVNGTIFAYGQTASGKTHTIKGSDSELGLLHLGLQQLFLSMKDKYADRDFLLRVIYMEIYNQKIFDLLDARNDNELIAPSEDLEVHEDEEKGVFVKNLSFRIVTSVEDVLNVLAEGEERRHYGETRMNRFSSRSHTIFRLIIESSPSESGSGDEKEVGSRKKPKEDKVRISQLNFVDLAGSERLSQTGAVGIRAKEGRSINTALHHLGQVIKKLADGAGGHVPYRASSLTRILQSSLGGNALTAIICNVSPALANMMHTISTLTFASNAIRVKTHAKVNEVSSDKALLRQNSQKSRELRSRLSEMYEGGDRAFSQEEWEKKLQEQKALSLEQQRKLHQMELFRWNIILRESNNIHKGNAPRTQDVRSSKQSNSRRRNSCRPASDDLSKPVSKSSFPDANFFCRVLSPEEQTFFRIAYLEKRCEALQNAYSQLEQKSISDNEELLDQIEEHFQEKDKLSTRVNHYVSENAALYEELKKSQEKNLQMSSYVLMITQGTGLEDLSDLIIQQLDQELSAASRRVSRHALWREFQRSIVLDSNGSFDISNLSSPPNVVPLAPSHEDLEASAFTANAHFASRAVVLEQEVAALKLQLTQEAERASKLEELLASSCARNDACQAKLDESEEKLEEERQIKIKLDSTLLQYEQEVQKLKQACREHEATVFSLRQRNWDKELELLARYKEKEKSSTTTVTGTPAVPISVTPPKEESIISVPVCDSGCNSDASSTASSNVSLSSGMSFTTSPLSTPIHNQPTILSPLHAPISNLSSCAPVPTVSSAGTPSGASTLNPVVFPTVITPLSTPHVTFNIQTQPSKPKRVIIPTAHSKTFKDDDKKTLPRSMAMNKVKANTSFDKVKNPFQGKGFRIPRNKTGTIRKDELIALGYDKSTISAIANMSGAPMSIVAPPSPCPSSITSLEEDDEENCNFNGRVSTGSVKSVSSDGDKSARSSGSSTDFSLSSSTPKVPSQVPLGTRNYIPIIQDPFLNPNPILKTVNGGVPLGQLFKDALSTPNSGLQFGV